MSARGKGAAGKAKSRSRAIAKVPSMAPGEGDLLPAVRTNEVPVSGSELVSSKPLLPGGREVLRDAWRRSNRKKLARARPRPRPEDQEEQLLADSAALHALAANDEVEGMYATLALAAYNTAMDCYQQAATGSLTPECQASNRKYALKFSEMAIEAMEGLNRHRGKGQQKVTVEHIQVGPGAQAIIRSQVHTGGGGGKNLEDQPHANAAGIPLRSTDEEQSSVPGAGNGQRAVSDARGHVDGCSEG